MFPRELEPDTLQRLAEEELSALLRQLQSNGTPLAQVLEKLTQQHYNALQEDPSQFTLQMRARVARNSDTSDWLDSAEFVERRKGLALRSRTLYGLHRPERWKRSFHSNLVHSLLMLPDGETVVSAGEDGKLLSWKVAGEPSEPQVLSGHNSTINHLALSPDGTWMATAGDDQTVGLWKTSTLSKPKKLKGHTHYVRQVAFTNEHLVSVSQDGNARVWSLPDGKCIRTLEHGQDVMSLAVSSDGTMLATTTINSAIHLWDLQTGNKIAQLYGNDAKVLRVMSGLYLGGTNNSGVGHKEYPHCMGFFPGGKVLWSMGVEWILWDLETQKELQRGKPITQFSAEDVCWIDPERVAIAGNGVAIVRVRDENGWLAPEQQERLASLGVGLENATAVCFLPDGKTLLSGHRNGLVQAWDLSVDPRTVPESAHTGMIYDLETSPSGNYAVSKSAGDSICVWDLRDGRCIDKTNLHSPNSYGHWVAFSRDESLLALADGKGWIQVRNVSSGGEFARVQIPSDVNYQAVSSVCFGEDNNTLYAGLGTGGLFRVPLDNPSATVKGEGYSYSPAKIWFVDANTVLTEDQFAPSDNANDWKENVYQLLRWSTTPFLRVQKVSAEKPPQGKFTSFGDCTLLPEGLLTLSGENDPSLVLRDPHTLDIKYTLDVKGTYFTVKQVLTDQRVVLSVSTGNNQYGFFLFDPQRNRTESVAKDPEGWSTQAISRDGSLAVRTNKNKLEVYKFPSGNVVARFFADDDLRYGCIGPNGTTVLVGDTAGRVHHLELNTSLV